MSDLKSKAEAAIAETEEWKAAGEHWPQWNRRYLDFRSEATPKAVLALLAENESLRADAERYRYARWNGILKKGKPMDTYFVYNEEADAYVDIELANRSPENH